MTGGGALALEMERDARKEKDTLYLPAWRECLLMGRWGFRTFAFSLRTNMKRLLCVRTPEGQKTKKMLEVEKRIGQTLEKDFNLYYVEKGWGQKRLANRWGVKKDLVFHSNARNRSRSWVEMLNLPARRIETEIEQPIKEADHKHRCEICEEFGEHFDKAHWISAEKGGSDRTFNILRLCPNCHRMLDRDASFIAERAREVLLFREVKRIIETAEDSIEIQRKLVKICAEIVNRTIG